MALFVGAALGFISSAFLLSGDDYGKVNILILLALFVALPVVGAIVSILSLAVREPRLVTSIKARILFLGEHLQIGHSEKVQKLTILYHGQYAGVGWAAGSIAALFLLLLFTDMHFVWRSTLLTPEVILPVLQAVSVPWMFWESAQPTQELLAVTQDSRLTTVTSEAEQFSKWWPFVLACQLCYALLLRLLVMGLIQLRITQASCASNKPLSQTVPSATSTMPLDAVHHLPKKFLVVNWAGFTSDILEQLTAVIGHQTIINEGPLADESVSDTTTIDNKLAKVVLVKAWEPPLQELKDYLDNNMGFIYPVEIQQDKVAAPGRQHLQEWQRFISNSESWLIFIRESDIV